MKMPGNAAPVEPDESGIKYAKIPLEGGSVIPAFARLEAGRLIVCPVDGEWIEFTVQ